MRALFLRVIFGTAILANCFSFAQMHKVAKPEQVVRAVGVYEWTGDFAKPAASRLIPVSLFIEGKLEDAGIYIARPIPFALLPGNLYILQSAGVDKGTLDLAYARHLQAVESTGDLAFDDGWFGYGSVKPLAAPRKITTTLKPSKTLPVITAASADPNRPHLVTKTSGDTAPAAGSDQSKPPATQTTNKPDATTASSTSSTPTSNDPDRPTMKRRDSSGTTTTASGTTPDQGSATSSTTTTSTPADDPDRPTMKRRTPDSTASGNDTTTTTASTTQTGSTQADDPDRPTMKRRSPDSTTDTNTDSTGSTTANGPASADDPDRPTLKRHTAQDAKKAGTNSTGDSVTGIGSLNDDPSRPNLHRGKPTSSMTEADLPKLTGLPSNLHQMVAVSDAANRDPHSFTLDWDDENQHQAILQKMQALARAQLGAYGSTPATPTPAVKKTTPTPATRTHRAAAPAPPPTPLLDEELKAYMLSYGGAATYIYSANTGGTGAALRYVTIVAQADGLGEIKPAIQSVTDAAHLNRSPKMQFVDVVDAEASNRASLLFELRSQNARQFALYRVIASHPEQIFLTGTTQ
jgi:hypothetical protein